MTRTSNSGQNREQKSIPEMLSRYLHRQAESAGFTGPDMLGEVTPYEAAPVQPVDARLAWDGALTAARFYQPEIDANSMQLPPHWPSLVATHEPAAAVAFSLGNFPQLVRDLHGLLGARDLAALRPVASSPLPAPELADWAARTMERKQYPQSLLALGALRLARHFEPAAQLFEKHQSGVPAAWRAAWANEQAALAWHQGQAEEAARLWQSLEESVPVLFNRGMAALFLGKHVKARSWLKQAVAQLPETGAWHHLGRLYLALAEMQGRKPL